MFLASLIDRALDGRTAIAPRRASRYEADLGVAEPARVEAETQAPPRVRPPEPAIGVEPPISAAASLSVQAEPPRSPRTIPNPTTVPPQPAITAPRADPSTIAVRLEQLARPVEPMAQAFPTLHAAPTTPTSEPDAPTIRELHTHERVEVRHEPREIERRLETLTREHLIERIARAEATPPAPAAAPASRAAAPTAAAEPLRPHATQAPPIAPPSRRDALPNLFAAPPEPPGQTVVHVSIGRVEIRNTAPAPAARTAARTREPRTGLDDYLRRREQA